MTMKFDAKTWIGRTFADGFGYAESRDNIYVQHPVAEIQKLNVFTPVAYLDHGSVNGYTAETAPILMPNTVGGYLPGPADQPGEAGWPSRGKTIEAALRQGYVVVSAGIRGRTTLNAVGNQIGGAPALLIDMKAAVRWVKANAALLPGRVDRIITNGTSAGGALSALTGASGNDVRYESELQRLGAADEDDSVFAASVYCPIHNLEHADMAYEWQFNGINDFNSFHEVSENGKTTTQAWHGTLSPAQQELSAKLKASFPAYLNSLNLHAPDGTPLSLRADGNGSFLTYLQSLLIASAQHALDIGATVPTEAGFTMRDGKMMAVDWPVYLRYIGRMKSTPAFDSLSLSSPENNEFEDRHFTAFSQQMDSNHSPLAPADLIAAMNPLTAIGSAKTAQHWRIRHGAADRDTSFAIPTILALTLQNRGFSVDFALPWATPHDGDYDLPELFAWIDRLCKKETLFGA
ncbi:subtype B tannase [Lacticaseibacillus mingshuiensis]|uniref:Subtype B tannase n=1 Tax=Lacticaseibacillus mingshuiensis TaxID=2799574 RepID=A0ABW4CFK0_9LACO|nr:subtype B tannase [Lacticaseibacillus mingshuiensis]